MRAVPAILLATLVAAATPASASVTSLSDSTEFVSAAVGAAMWTSSPDGLPAHGEPAVATTDLSLLAPGAMTPRTRRIHTPEYVRLSLVGTDADDVPVAFVMTSSATYRVAFDGSSGPVRARDPSHGEFAMEGGRVARIVDHAGRERVEVAATLAGLRRPVLDVPARARISSMALGRHDTALLVVRGASRTTRDRAELWRVRRGAASRVLRTARDHGPTSGIGDPIVSHGGTRVSVSRWSSSASRPNDVSTFSVATGRPLARRPVVPHAPARCGHRPRSGPMPPRREGLHRAQDGRREDPTRDAQGPQTTPLRCRLPPDHRLG